MRRSRGLAAPVLATCLLVAVAGCSPSGAGASAGAAASPTSSPSIAATPTPTVPESPSPSSTAGSSSGAHCDSTTAMDTRTRFRFLQDLPGEVLRNQRTLYLTVDGVHFASRTFRQPCEAQEMAVTLFRVVARAGENKDRKTGQTYALAFQYETIGDRRFTIAPGGGPAEGSRLPAPTACEGTVAVLHLGDAIREASLPEQLNFAYSGPTSAPLPGSLSDNGATNRLRVTGELVLDAQFLPPSAPDTCKG
ncbi:hypothetical protein ACIRP0_17470 [Streptomyces sp. NPDC101733]|uniref:hypothetical protein n=1 Tax=unclassified Streptomyces TaxID=2593676 RepID=UPI003819F468